MALSALNIGPLSGYYETWKETNPEMVQARESSLQLQQSMADLAESIQPLLTKVAEIATAFLDWFNGLSSGGQKAVFVLAGVAGSISPVAKAISGLTSLIPKLSKTFPGLSEKMPGVTGLFDKLSIKAIAVAGAISAIVFLAVKVAEVWDDMSGVEKAVSLFGLLASAALTAALAMGVFTTTSSMGLAVAGIVAGILLVVAAIKTAASDAGKLKDSLGKTSGRKYATGTDYHPGGEALVGENGPELVRMPRGSRVYSTSDTKEMMSNSGAQSVDITLRVVAGDSLARDLSFQVDRATQLRGIKVVSGV